MHEQIELFFEQLSLKNKFFFSVLAVILIISGTIALLARWILVSGLTQELEMRGTAIARSVSSRAGEFIIEGDTPRLLSLIFDEKQLRERKNFVAYIFITDVTDRVVCHTFTRNFPYPSGTLAPLQEHEQHRVQLVQTFSHEALDIAVPINEGLYRIGTVHVGLSKAHMDSLVGKLRAMFLGFISAVIIITFWVSHKLARRITDPVVQLTHISDDLSRGDFSTASELDISDKGWSIDDCPAYSDTDMPCWHFDEQQSVAVPDKALLHRCITCVFYRKRDGDELIQLADSFRNMVWSIRLYRQRLRESETTYRSLFSSGPDPIFVVSCDSRKVLDANPRAEECYGYSREELVGMPFSQLGPEANIACENFSDKSYSKAVHTPRVVHRKHDGTPIIVNVNASTISYRGKPAIIVAAADVTTMMEKDAQLIQASKMKSLGEMSAGVAHELNQPLNAIRLGSDFLMMAHEQGAEVSSEQYGQVLHEITTQVDRAAEIITTLRGFGRKADLFDEEIVVNTSISSVIRLLGRQFVLHNVVFSLALAENLPCIVAHDNRLQQVMFNLVTNARDAILERRTGHDFAGKGVITITTYTESDRVCISVADNGSGIPPAVRDNVFEPFFTTKATGEGMGLGLAICYDIIHDYGGDIRIADGPDGGCVFTLCFPAVAQQNL